MRRLVASSLAFGCWVCAVPAQAALPFSLNEALATAYETNPQLNSERAGLRALDETVAQANGGWRPTISASGSYGVQQDRIDNVSKQLTAHPLVGQVAVQEPIFRGGRTYAEIGQAIARVHAGRARLAQTEQQILFAAVTAYMDVVRDADVARSNAQNVSMLQQQLDAVKTQFDHGAVTRTDVSQTEARLARARSDAANANQKLASSRAEFRNVIGRMPETLESRPHLPVVPKSQDAAESISQHQHPIILEAKASERAADYGVTDAFGTLLPQVDVTGRYQFGHDASGLSAFTTQNTQRVLSVTGDVTIPIYQAGAEQAAVRRAKELHSQTKIDIETAQRAATQDVETAWNSVLAANLSVSADEAQLQANQAALDGVVQEQRAGERQVLDVLNAQQELLGAQVALAAARHDQVVANYQLLAATGQLSARYLGLRVKVYDPTEHYDEDADAWFGLGD